MQHRAAKTTDASTLLMPLMKFISPTDPRWLSTLRAIEQELVDDSLVFRYRPRDAAPDGLIGEEGTFNMCSFWYVEALARAGDVDQARFIFEKMLGYANHLGLYSEELGPRGEHLGNFPQAFSHLALISAAYCLDRGDGRRREAALSSVEPVTVTYPQPVEPLVRPAEAAVRQVLPHDRDARSPVQAPAGLEPDVEEEARAQLAALRIRATQRTVVPRSAQERLRERPRTECMAPVEVGVGVIRVAGEIQGGAHARSRRADVAEDPGAHEEDLAAHVDAALVPVAERVRERRAPLCR